MALSVYHRRQIAMMEAVERQFQPQYKRELARAYDAMVDGWLANGVVPSAQTHRANIQDIVNRTAKVSIRVFGAQSLTMQRDASLQLEQKDFAETLTRLAVRYITQEAVRRRISSIADTTRANIINAVQRGFLEGLGQSGTADFIRDLVPALTSARSGLIARTETHGAANYGMTGAAKATGLDMRKEWVSAEDDRTRPDHAAANGLTVGMDEDFIIGGISMAQPGDPSAPADQVCNCRCVVAFVPA